MSCVCLHSGNFEQPMKSFFVRLAVRLTNKLLHSGHVLLLLATLYSCTNNSKQTLNAKIEKDGEMIWGNDGEVMKIEIGQLIFPATTSGRQLQIPFWPTTAGIIVGVETMAMEEQIMEEKSQLFIVFIDNQILHFNSQSLREAYEPG